MKKMLVSDYDQTFYLNDKDIEKNKITVNRFMKEGNIFVIATGRSYYDFKNKLDIYNFNYDYVIINHGSTILDKDNNIIESYYIDNSIINSIKNDLDISNSVNYFCCNIENSRLDFDSKDLTKIHVKYESEQKAKEINNLINEKYSKYINSYYVSVNAVEIISNKTNKANAIEKLKELENISQAKIFTIGDGYSDIEMIKRFDGYCMEESVFELLNFCKNKKVKSVKDLVDKLINESI